MMPRLRDAKAAEGQGAHPGGLRRAWRDSSLMRSQTLALMPCVEAPYNKIIVHMTITTRAALSLARVFPVSPEKQWRDAAEACKEEATLDCDVFFNALDTLGLL